LSRRDLLKFSGASLLGASLSGWLNVLAARAQETRQTRHKRCVLLWMDGGPFRAVQTNVPGIQISEHFPRFAQLMNHASLIRGMSTPEGAHGRAKYYM